MHAANRSQSAGALEPGAARSVAARSTQHGSESLDNEIGSYNARVAHFRHPHTRSILCCSWPIRFTCNGGHCTKQKARKIPGFLFLYTTRQALRFFNQAAICGTRRSRNVTRVWMVLMAVSASRREVGAR